MVLYLRELSYTHMNVSGSFQAGIFAGFEWGTVTKWCDVTFSHISSHSRFDVTLPGVEKVCFSTSKNVTIFLELGTNVTISSHRHIIFLGSAWNKTEFQNLARSWVLGSSFFNSSLERPSDIKSRFNSDSPISIFRVDLNPLKKKFTRSYVRNVRTDFPSPFLNWYKKDARFVFRTCFGPVMYVRARRHCERSPKKCQKIARCSRCAVYGSRPPIASKSGSSPPERPGPDNITNQTWFDATCPCITISSTLSGLFQQKERDKAEVSTSRGGTGARCVRPWLTRKVV